MLTLEALTIVQDDFRLEADFSLPRGARVAVIGPSGSGKSTLLGAIAGFVPLTSGRVLWEGADLAPLPPGQRPLSILFQDQNLFPHLTVDQNLGLGISPSLRLTAADRARIAEALDRMGLEGLGARKPAQLSGGQQSRVALARALLRARPLLLLDEPFAALGPALKAEMLEVLSEIAGEQGTTVLMVSHDPADALAFAPLSVLVADGRAHPPQPTAPLLANPPPALAAYLG
ncbi:thiamine ABC transporter ATP-binding protein [Rhodobacter veldkampii DSM 11550]|uniref:Thiamine ABC transporter ATP-binding protein n=1 Tax=Phaeovulum veldkampii DSM 11550 TaxID=1185920 RepID=A0A2T4JH94_9RHOB|nr:ATP-binding cassette domain-containing protein [Phaeovulum veldkampii]MBK5945297.1 thiamine ABC transporter ATP-binding protein [Phaeovulum veldkampii DSM 11550]PTE17147.1 thiamine ABC transporter ATP-binding protein [Phaeovulum veldkampii DSM 11550]TDQ56175.1 thiamine transport system ATP-binding protein [Phaeovulum veldkampii DSM 11550]